MATADNACDSLLTRRRSPTQHWKLGLSWLAERTSKKSNPQESDVLSRFQLVIHAVGWELTALSLSAQIAPLKSMLNL